MPESPGMTRWILVSLGGFSYLPEDSEDIPFGISGLAPSFIYIPLISPSLIVWYGNCSTESQLRDWTLYGVVWEGGYGVFTTGLSVSRRGAPAAVGRDCRGRATRRLRGSSSAVHITNTDLALAGPDRMIL